MMQWQIATWKEALNENFVLQKDQKQCNEMARKQYLFWNLTLFSYAVFLTSRLFSVHHYTPYLELSWASPQLLNSFYFWERCECGMQGSWRWAQWKWKQSDCPRKVQERRDAGSLCSNSATTRFKEETGLGLCPSASLGWALKVALNPST